MLHPADFTTFTSLPDATAIQAIEGVLGRFVHEAAPRHADDLDADALMLRAVIASATCADDDEFVPVTASLAA